MGSAETDVKKYITSLLTSTPLIVTIEQLSKDYRNTIGVSIPFQKLGYNSVEHLLRCIPDTVQVKGCGPRAQVIPVISDKSAHINQLVTSQKVVTKRNHGYIQKRGKSMSPRYKHPTGNIKPLEISSPSMSKSKIYYPVKKNNASFDNSSQTIPENLSSDPYSCTTKSPNNNNTSLNSSSEPISGNLASNSYSCTTKSPKDNASFNSPSEPISGNLASNSYSCTTKSPNDNASLNCSSNSISGNFASNSYSCTTKSPNNSISKNNSDCITKQTNGRNDKEVYKWDEKEDVSEKNKSISETTPNSKWTGRTKKFEFDKFSGDQVEDSIPIQIRQNLRSLIRQCPKGIWCADIPEKYRNMFGRNLDYQELGFKSLIDLCVSLSSIFHYVRPSTEDYKLYDRSKPLPDCAEKTFTMASYATNSKGSPDEALPNIDWADSRRYLPKDIFMPGGEIPKVFIPSEVKEDDSIEVVPGEIYDLSKFWVYLYDSGLEELMDQMQEFYKHHAQEYLIPEHLIQEGIYCVQVIYGEYHRALIVDTMPELENTVRVIFIDYGTNAKVSTKGLCFLNIMFSKLPAQAIRCRLANVEPLEEGMPWSQEACKAFRRLLFDRELSAKINHIDWEDHYLEVYLMDITEEDTFYINDRLIEEGFAQQPKKERQQSFVNSLCAPIVNHLHLFPTFLELERGFAPPSSEMETFVQCNIPINFCYPQYFYIDHSDQEKIIREVEKFYEENYINKGKKRTPVSYCFNMQEIKYVEDLSIFGDLRNEIEEFVTMSTPAKEFESNDEDFTDADENGVENRENSPSDYANLSEHLKEFCVKEQETVDFLKQDLLVVTDIMNDINDIYRKKYSDNRSDITHSSGHANDTSSQNSINEGGKMTSTKTETLRGTNIDSPVDLANHPLSKMKFEEDEYCVEADENKNKQNCDLTLPDIRLPSINFSYLPKDDPLSIIHRLKIKAEKTITDFLEDKPCFTDESNDKVYDHDLEDSCTNTNPFLNNLDSDSKLEIDISKLNPNNPFLKFLQNDKSETSSVSSNSTSYESPPEIKPQPWSNFNDISIEEISQLGKSLRGTSTSSSALSLNLAEDKRSCSTQTLELQSKGVQAAVPPQPQFPTPTPLDFPPWGMNWANPYYSVKFANFQAYSCEPCYGPGQQNPLFYPQRPRPPPGFCPTYPENMFPPANFDSTQYRQQRPTNYCLPVHNLGQGSGRPLPTWGPAHAVNAPPNVASVASAVGESRDFYAAYNEQLLQKLNTGNH